MHRPKWILPATVIAWVMAVTAHASAEPVDVRTTSGVLTGDLLNGVESFRGVPFAQPPLGPLRWAPPSPLAAWPAKRDALANGPACPQTMKSDGTPNAGGAAGRMSEDCLTLNVFAPKAAAKAPVMVWLYGGGNVAGSNALSSYDGHAFARDGVILVALNYRLGALGFFAHPALTRAGRGGPVANYALMDQIAGLQWVHDNIQAFGGDPANVTLFGESAGGQDALALMSAPSARGLFVKAIIESGAGWAEPVSLAAAEARGLAMASEAGLSPDAELAQLRALPLDAVLKASGPFGPIVDGDLLPESPTQAVARGHLAAVPLIIGSNSFEASLMAGLHLPPETYLRLQPPAVLAAYAAEPDPQARSEAVFTDQIMGAPARWIARLHSRAAPTWLYYFSFRRAVYKDILPGAPHASEIPFVFDSWDALDSRLSRGPATAADRALTSIMHRCWVSFARSGTPECQTPEPWPAFAATADRRLEFGQTVGVLRDFRRSELDAQDAGAAALIAP